MIIQEHTGKLLSALKAERLTKEQEDLQKKLGLVTSQLAELEQFLTSDNLPPLDMRVTTSWQYFRDDGYTGGYETKKGSKHKFRVTTSRIDLALLGAIGAQNAQLPTTMAWNQKYTTQDYLFVGCEGLRLPNGDWEQPGRELVSAILAEVAIKLNEFTDQANSDPLFRGISLRSATKEDVTDFLIRKTIQDFCLSADQSFVIEQLPL